MLMKLKMLKNNMLDLIYNVSSNLTDDSIDDIFTMRKLNMLEISFLQYSIIYGAKKCFDYLINITETDNINLGRHSPLGNFSYGGIL